eukprot:6245394-Karenia_brevis.AAC.1
MEINDVWEIGKHDERWRFKIEYTEPSGPSGHDLVEADPLHDLSTVKPMSRPPRAVWGQRDNFPEISAAMIDKYSWGTVVAGPWRGREKIHLLEGRATLLA